MRLENICEDPGARGRQANGRLCQNDIRDGERPREVARSLSQSEGRRQPRLSEHDCECA